MSTFKVEECWYTDAGYIAACVIVNKSHRCGYVGVPQDHPLYLMSYENFCLDVHGGLTFSDLTGPTPSENLEDKAYPIETEDYTWWFGFDCAHYGDGHLPGSYIAIQNYLDGFEEEFPPRSKSYVIEECESLARQLKSQGEELLRNNLFESKELTNEHCYWLLNMPIGEEEDD
jgi:hypothetical protein